LGFESDEPWKIAFRFLLFGFMVYYSGEICAQINIIFSNIIDFILTRCGISATEVWEGMKNSLNIENIFKSTVTGVAFVQILLYIFLIVKVIGILLRLGYRFMLFIILTLTSSLAFACGVSKSTKGILNGWTRLYTGNLVMQMLQIVIVCIILSIQSHQTQTQLEGIVSQVISTNIHVPAQILTNLVPVGGCLMQFFLVIAACTVLEKLEMLAREVSLTLGVNYGNIMGPVDLISEITNIPYMLGNISGSGSGPSPQDLGMMQAPVMPVR